MTGGRRDADEHDQELATFERDVLLATGRAVRIRPARPADVGALGDFYAELSDTSNYYRFFGLRRFIPADELAVATVQAVRAHVTLVAEAGNHLLGIGEYHARPGGEEAEVAFAVADLHQHEGIGTVLLEDLAMIARSAGFRRLVAETMPGNSPMRRVFRTVGLVTREWFADGVVHVQLDLTTAHLMEDDADLRDWRSAVESLRPILQPSHVVVIGASRHGSGPGRRILDHLRASFAGRISVVHPSAATIGGVESVGRISELDAVPDLAIIAVSTAAAVGVVDDCGRAGVAAAVVISSGFAEQDDDGRRRQDELLATARSHGMRIVGPNCLGVVSTRCGLNATFTAQRFLPGGIAIAAQSGGVGIAIAAEAEQRNAGISAFVSMGNKVDVSSNDLLRLWADDDDTNVALIYLESFGDPIRFARVARAVSRRMPIVALKAGRTEPGRRGARSHTAALATDDVVVDALFAHTGVIRARTLEELIDVGLLLDRQPAPAGSRVALIGNAGGPLILGADVAADRDLDVPELSAALRAAITDLVPAVASTANPVDLTSAMNADQLAAVTRAVAASGEVDACIVAVVDVDESSGDMMRSLPVSGLGVPIAVSGRTEVDLPVYPSAERAAAAVALAAQRARWLTNVAEEDAEAPETPTDAAELAVARRIVRGGATTDGWLEPIPAFEAIASRWHPGRTVAVRPIARSVRRRGAACRHPMRRQRRRRASPPQERRRRRRARHRRRRGGQRDLSRPDRPLRRPTPRRPRPGPGHSPGSSCSSASLGIPGSAQWFSSAPGAPTPNCATISRCSSRR